MSKILRQRNWAFDLDGHQMKIQYTQYISLRDEICLIIDDLQVARKLPSYTIGTTSLHAVIEINGVPRGLKLEVWHGASLWSIEYRVLLDGSVFKGNPLGNSLLESLVPNEKYTWYYCNYGIVCGLSYSVGMQLIEPGSFLTMLYLFCFFSVGFSAAVFLLSKIVSR